MNTELEICRNERAKLIAALRNAKGFAGLHGEDLYRAIDLHPGTVAGLICAALDVLTELGEAK